MSRSRSAGRVARQSCTLWTVALVASVLVSAPSAAQEKREHHCFGREATIVGTNGDDNLRGTDGDDVIAGLGGDDTIVGRAGDDRLCAGPGGTIAGPPGEPEASREHVTGGPGGDRISGGSGYERLLGGPGRDVVIGGRNAGELPDEIWGNHGADVLRGSGGSDEIEGGPGDDELHGGHGIDLLRGEEGDDLYDGGGGRDGVVTSWEGDRGRAYVNLATGEAHGTGRDVLRDVESASAGYVPVTAIGDDGPNGLAGADHNDRLYGRGGADRLTPSSGRDVAAGGAGDDIFMIIERGKPALRGGDGSDRIELGELSVRDSVGGATVDLVAGRASFRRFEIKLSSIEDVVGTREDDRLRGNRHSNTLRATRGEDVVTGAGGADFLKGWSR